MDSEERSEEFWKQVPHTELPLFASAEKTAADVHALKQFIEPADLVLDLGCGWGRISCALVSDGYRVMGIDLSENLITYARQYSAELGMKIQFEVASAMDIPHTDESFDKVICLWGVFNHLLTSRDQIQALNEMHRVLRPDGLAFIEMGNGERKEYRHIMSTDGYGHENRIIHLQFKDGSPPNAIYIHDRSTLKCLLKQTQFKHFQVRFQNINRKRRIVAYLFKSS